MTEHQFTASDPSASVWVSASAGTGKTKVLVDRFLRTLLLGVAPEKILCLTFTNATAAEMDERVKKELSKWCTASADDLRTMLFELTHADPSPQTMERARHLFARILEARGGLKTMTIHSFCQTILYRFPLEAGISPSFDVIDDLAAKDLKRSCQEEIFSDDGFAIEIDLISKYLRSDKSIADLLSDMMLKKELIEQAVYKDIGARPVHRPAIDTEETRQLLSGALSFDDYKFLFIRKTDGQPRQKADANEAENVMRTVDALNRYEMDLLSNAILRIGKAVFGKYASKKTQRGEMDFDDLIDKTLALLSRPDASAWIMYKLDDGIDHILVDEAQDTSPKQWKIIQHLTEEFFSGEGKKDDLLRTLFVVGDEKQSIYSFQGADLQAFLDSKAYFKKKITDADLTFREVPLSMSFRSTPPILDIVNAWIGESFLPGKHERHLPSEKRGQDSGIVELWPLETEPVIDKDILKDLTPLQRLNLERIPGAEDNLTKKIVQKIEDMIKGNEILPSKNRPIRPSDILVLFKARKNNPMIDGIIRGLKEKHIPVSGIDRMILTDHIATQDLIAFTRALLNRKDDYSLACALKSPIFNLTEEDLFELSAKRDGSLFEEILKRKKYDDTARKLLYFLSKMDQTPPFEFFHGLLYEFGAKKDFIRRLGNEVSEALEEFLSLCLTFEQTHIPSLELFIEWLSNEEIEIKRETENKNLNAVRIMTIHGAKGLQAPIVFLVDTRRGDRNSAPLLFDKAGNLHFAVRKEYHYDTFKDLKAQDDLKQAQEYNRLLYVALTRAEDRLYIAGHAGEEALENGWFDQVHQTFGHLQKDGLDFLLESPQKRIVPPADSEDKPTDPSLPAWFFASLPDEKPIDVVNPSGFAAAPFLETEAMKTAKEKGLRIHAAMEKKTGPGERAEVPIIGKIDDVRYAGRIDRLIERDTEVILIDYKTGKCKTPVPESYVRQMDIYRSLVKPLFPGKKIVCQLLWTDTGQTDEI